MNARRRRQRQAAKLFKFDRGLGARFVAGADEAGRGSLAGPLVAAAVLIDYGAYVDRINTIYAPQGLLPFDGLDGEQGYVDLDVPVQDLRAIRRAILDITEFKARHLPRNS